MNQNPRILITGATGFMGRAVLKNLLARQMPLRAVVRTGGNKALLDATAQNPALELIGTEDLFSEDAKWWTETCAGVDLVIHLAWYVDPRDYLTSPLNFSCLSGTLTMAQGAAKAGVSRFVGVGTCFEYDFSPEDMDVENTPLRPLTPYAAAKVSAFHCLQQWLSTTDTEFLWARLFYLYGDGEPPGRLVPSLHAHLSRAEPVPLSSGNQVRDFMDSNAAANLLVEAALSPNTGAFNVCSGKGTTVRALAEKIAAEYGRPDLLHFGARPDKLVDPPRIVGVPTKITKKS